MFDELRQQIIEHPSNIWAKNQGYTPVYMASASARLVIVGQAPGSKAQTSHTPWNDVSGQTLRQWLGMSDKQFYDESIVSLMPMDFYYPGKGKHGDMPPRPDFAPLWHPKLREHMPNVRLTLLVGQYAQKYYLGKNAGRNLTETVMNYEKYLPDYFPLVHPSPLNFRWRSKNPWFEREVVPVLKRQVQALLATA